VPVSEGGPQGPWSSRFKWCLQSSAAEILPRIPIPQRPLDDWFRSGEGPMRTIFLTPKVAGTNLRTLDDVDKEEGIHCAVMRFMTAPEYREPQAYLSNGDEPSAAEWAIREPATSESGSEGSDRKWVG